jgi:hypothetical protein
MRRVFPPPDDHDFGRACTVYDVVALTMRRGRRDAERVHLKM